MYPSVFRRVLRTGALDAALVILPLDDTEVAYEPVLRESLMVALPERHPLARQRAIALPDLSETTAISIPRHLNPSYHESLMACCARLGLKVRYRKSPRRRNRFTWSPKVSASRSLGNAFAR
jgi:DNA-binding transcriptional LysR family regulator